MRSKLLKLAGLLGRLLVRLLVRFLNSQPFRASREAGQPIKPLRSQHVFRVLIASTARNAPKIANLQASLLVKYNLDNRKEVAAKLEQ